MSGTQIHFRKSERGQAMTEFAIYVPVAVLMTFMLLSWIPLHRARTMAISASYACAQFLSQARDPANAARNAYQIAMKTLEGDWSGSVGVQYAVSITPPTGRGRPGYCRVTYQAPILFNVLGLSAPRSEQRYISRAERWKANW